MQHIFYLFFWQFHDLLHTCVIGEKNGQFSHHQYEVNCLSFNSQSALRMMILFLCFLLYWGSNKVIAGVFSCFVGLVIIFTSSFLRSVSIFQAYWHVTSVWDVQHPPPKCLWPEKGPACSPKIMCRCRRNGAGWTATWTKCSTLGEKPKNVGFNHLGVPITAKWVWVIAVFRNNFHFS